MCFILIVSVNTCSIVYCEGSEATDAFITKDEFDKAMADFNTRLSVFEAGINSKIDSQVTSYLDRNGIWSKKEQEFSFTDTVMGLTYGARGLACAQLMIPLAGGTDAYIKVEDGSSTYQAYKIAQKGTSYYNKVLVEKINKSGLCYMVYNMYVKPYVNGSLNENVNIQIGTTATNASYYDNLVCSFNIMYCMHQDTYSRDNILTSFSYAWAHVLQCVPKVYQYGLNVSFFVKSGKPLYISKIIQSNISNFVCWKYSGGSNKTGEITNNIEINSIDVY